LSELAAVVGLGRYGGGLGLTRHLLINGHRVRLFDLLPEEELAEYLKELAPWQDKLETVFGPHELKDFEGISKCYLNPAVPWAGGLADKLRDGGFELSSDIECFFENWKLPVIGLTGSNGKSTCWEMMSKLLTDWSCGGNRGVSVFDMRQDDVKGCLLELSSFQLERIQHRFSISMVTTFTPDHLDQHGDIESYRLAKERVSAFQKEEDLCVLGRGLGSWPTLAKTLMLGRDFDFEGQTLVFSDGRFGVSEFPLVGGHNKDLLALAIAASRRALGDDVLLQQRLNKLCEDGMKPLPYRQNIISKTPVTIVNDSKATTPESTICAIEAFTSSEHCLHLICGGKEKELDVAGIVTALKKTRFKLYVIGEQVERWRQTAAGLPFEDCGNLKAAIDVITKNIVAGDALLFSPGTSSFDQYKNYKDRGEDFDHLVQKVLTKGF